MRILLIISSLVFCIGATFASPIPGMPPMPGAPLTPGIPPSSIGGASCNIAMQPILKPGCMMSCENGLWHQNCPIKPSCDGAAMATPDCPVACNDGKWHKSCT